jgi:4-amino-4-deoxy-L-arabinose transferase-like glycosyltransferase
MRVASLLIAALCAGVLFSGLGRIGFVDPGEARDAAVARELIDRGELLTPVLGGEPLLDKPLLGYAVEAAGARLTPGSPVGARGLRAALALGLVLLTASIGGHQFGARAGWCAAGVLATSLAFPLAARIDGVQVLATLLGWVGAAGFADALFGRRAGRSGRLVVAYGALAIALVSAGPMAALWPIGGLALYLGLARRPDSWRLIGLWPGLGILVGLGIPWYGAMLERHGLVFLAHAPFFPYGIPEQSSWLSAPIRALAFLVLGFFPWSTLLPGAAFHAAIRWRPPRRGVLSAPGAGERPSMEPIAREHREESVAHFLIAALAAALGTLILSPRAPLTASLPALPAAALLCGRLLDHLLDDASRVSGHVASAGRMLALLGSTAAAGLALLAPRVGEATLDLRLLATFLLLASWAPMLASFRARHRAAAALLAVPVAIGWPLATLRLAPAMESYLNARAVADGMGTDSPERAPLVTVDPPPASLRLYLHRNLVPGGESVRGNRAPEESLTRTLEEFRAVDGFAYVAFLPRSEARVRRAALGKLEILMRTPGVVLARASVPRPP